MALNILKKEQAEVTNSSAEQLFDEGNAFSANADVYVSEDAALFYFDIPGVEKGDVKIEIDEENILIVRAKNSYEPVGSPAVQEYRIGDYYRSFKLSDEYDKNSIIASLEDGVLKVEVPRKEESKPHKIEINA
jgi:HSP20 family protein